MSDESEQKEVDVIGSAAFLMSLFGGLMLGMVLLSLPGPPPPRGMTGTEQVGISLAGLLLLLSGALTRRGRFVGVVLGNLCVAGWFAFVFVSAWSRLSMPLRLLVPGIASVPIFYWLQILKALLTAWRERYGTAKTL